MNREIHWPRNDYSRVPFWLHHDEDVYALEMERIFRGPAWSYLCLEAEIPKPGDFRTTWLGEIPNFSLKAREKYFSLPKPTFDATSYTRPSPFFSMAMARLSR